MPLTPEEQRALDYQAQERRREGFRRALARRLKGNEAAKKQVEDNFKPLRRS